MPSPSFDRPCPRHYDADGEPIPPLGHDRGLGDPMPVHRNPELEPPCTCPKPYRRYGAGAPRDGSWHAPTMVAPPATPPDDLPF